MLNPIKTFLDHTAAAILRSPAGVQWLADLNMPKICRLIQVDSADSYWCYQAPFLRSFYETEEGHPRRLLAILKSKRAPITIEISYINSEGPEKIARPVCNVDVIDFESDNNATRLLTFIEPRKVHDELERVLEGYLIERKAAAVN